MILEHFAAFLQNTASEPHTATSVSAVRLPQTETATAFFCGITATTPQLKDAVSHGCFQPSKEQIAL